MEEDKNRAKTDDIELPDKDISVNIIGGGLGRFTVGTFIAAVFIFAAFVVWYLWGREAIIRSVPKLERAWIVSRLEGEEIATDEPKLIRDGRGVMLYLVAYGLDQTTGEYNYYMESPADKLPRVVIGGEEIPRDRLHRFGFLETDSVVNWYKIEVSHQFYRDVSRSVPERLFWTKSLKHKMGNRWWAIADVRADFFKNYHYDFVGTMHFTADLMVFHSRDPEGLYVNLYSEGSKPEAPGLMPPGAHRITVIPTNRQGLDASYRAYMNLFAFQDHSGGPDAATMTENFLGGDSRSILIGALRLLGYRVSYDDPDFLDRIGHRIFSDVTIDQFSFFRPNGDGNRVIPYGNDGVRTGDVIVQGDRYAVLVRNEQGPLEPESGALTGDDLVLDAYNQLVMETYARIFEGSDKPIEIWRLDPGA